MPAALIAWATSTQGIAVLTSLGLFFNVLSGAENSVSKGIEIKRQIEAPAPAPEPEKPQTPVPLVLGMFLPNIFREKKGVIGSHPRTLDVYAIDEKTIVGQVTIRCSDEVPIGYQVFYREGVLLGAVDNLTERMPIGAGETPPDTIVFNPINYELILRNYMDQRQRYSRERPPLFGEKWPTAVEAQRRARAKLN